MRARALDPLSLETNVGLGQRLVTAGKPKEALRQMLATVELDRNYYDSYVHLANIYERLGSRAEAIATAELAVELSDRSAHALHTLAAIHVRQKQFAKARPLIAELETRSIQRNPYEIAMLYLEMNQGDKALLWLERACQERIPAMVFLKTAQEGRRFGIVRQHPRFARILQCVDKKVG